MDIEENSGRCSRACSDVARACAGARGDAAHRAALRHGGAAGDAALPAPAPAHRRRRHAAAAHAPARHQLHGSRALHYTTLTTTTSLMKRLLVLQLDYYCLCQKTKNNLMSTKLKF